MIDDLGGQGDGVVRRGGGASLFVAGALPGERVRVSGAGERRETLEILERSPDRQEPPCQHFGACGGCALQHLSEQPYRAFKIRALRSELQRAGLEPEYAPGFNAGAGERRRLALHARRSGGAVRLGLKGRRSWTVEPLTTCLVASPSIVKALPHLQEVARAFLGSPRSAPVLHVTTTRTGLAVDVTGVDAKRGLTADERAEAASSADRADLAQLTLEGEILFQARTPIVVLGGVEVEVPAGGFLQACPSAEAFMAGVVAAGAGGGRSAVDLFCGAGTFTFPLARQMPVVAYDGSRRAIDALASAARRASGLKPIRAEVRDLFERPITPFELNRFDVVALDPPRGGAEAQCAAIAAATVKTAVYVSCNPSSFVRDALRLRAGGFHLERVTPVDQFVWSPHMELVGVFRR